MSRSVIGALYILLLLAACQNTGVGQTSKDATGVPQNPVWLDHAAAGLAYVNPNTDFSRYTAILLMPLRLDNVEIIQPQSSISTIGNSNWQLTDAEKQRWQEDYREAMITQLSSAGGYTMVEDAAKNVLRISSRMTRIAPTAPKDDNSSRPMGRSRMFTEGAGKMSIEVTFSDSESGELLALTKDTRSGSSIWGINNSVTNAAEVRRVFNAWARQIRRQLDQLHNKE
jgi:Protein of unknown function (DUF3313)